MHPDGRLRNPQRDLLHLEIYRYLDGLKRMLSDLEAEKKRMGNVCASSVGVETLMEGMMTVFGKVIEFNVDNDDTKEMLPPLLEEGLCEELEERLGNRTIKGCSHSRGAGLTFEEYYEKLLKFKEEHGHVNGA